MGDPTILVGGEPRRLDQFRTKLRKHGLDVRWTASHYTQPQRLAIPAAARVVVILTSAVSHGLWQAAVSGAEGIGAKPISIPHGWARAKKVLELAGYRESEGGTMYEEKPRPLGTSLGALLAAPAGGEVPSGPPRRLVEKPRPAPAPTLTRQQEAVARLTAVADVVPQGVAVRRSDLVAAADLRRSELSSKDISDVLRAVGIGLVYTGFGRYMARGKVDWKSRPTEIWSPAAGKMVPWTPTERAQESSEERRDRVRPVQAAPPVVAKPAPPAAPTKTTSARPAPPQATGGSHMADVVTAAQMCREALAAAVAAGVTVRRVVVTAEGASIEV